VILANDLTLDQETQVLDFLVENQQALGWTLGDIRGISPTIVQLQIHLEEAPFADFCGDAVMGTDNSSIKHTDPICNEPLDLAPTSPTSLSTTPSHLNAYHASLGDTRGYNPSLIHIVIPRGRA